ncbi:MAG TPA: hypothetical protein VFS21_04850 [Roseiflexaceae bacterium]|nr:hypothetical protein [Roseiflexaceae bacterium]
MATPRKNSDERAKADERSVTRTYRAAIRIGEDFITLEETITLPADATDDEIGQAVDLGLRIYRAQREAIDAQISTIRESAGTPAPITVRDPDAPASDKQRNFIATLQDSLGWSSEQLAAYAQDQGLDLVTLNKGQASIFIDGLKKLSDERSAYGEGAGRNRGDNRTANGNGSSSGAPANDKQISALERLAQQAGLDLETETRRRYNIPVARLSGDQAAALLKELQRPAQGRREAAL